MKIRSVLGVLLVGASLVGGWLLMIEPAQKSGPAAKTELQIMLQPTGDRGVSIPSRIVCPGDLPRCARLGALRPEDFELAPGKICAAQYGGPSVARVRGRLNQEQIDVRLQVRNGCEIALWNKLAPALGLPPSRGASAL